MKAEIRILRRKSMFLEEYWQSIFFETTDENATVAYVLNQMNRTKGLTDAEGKKVELPIRWECSCLQKKCGACAMVINGRPRLACDTELREFQKKKKGNETNQISEIRLEPLRKFPVVADLIVDRSIMFENLRIMKTWVNGSGKVADKHSDEAYEASRCLQCGCCLEICPNFYPGGEFFGTAAFVPAARLLATLSVEEQQAIKEQYEQHVYAGCGKSLACRDVCPAGIDVDHLLSSSNGIAVWRQHG
ncbi:MAG: 4Fe-4S dicluster domain-containing protein [Lachnospiraceae bacterium]|nr:4Fe-4S dicluster domain-containing protein [Lachnospiraceae bacterium]